MTTLNIVFDSDPVRADGEEIQAILAADARYNRGEHVEAEHRLSFESFGLMTTVLSDKRCELISSLVRQPAASVRALAAALDRDYKRVHEDVVLLTRYGLVERTKKGLTAPYDEFRYSGRVRLGEPTAPASVPEAAIPEHA